MPGAYDVGLAVAAGCVAEGDRARDDLYEDRAGVGVPAGRVTRLEVEADSVATTCRTGPCGRCRSGRG